MFDKKEEPVTIAMERIKEQTTGEWGTQSSGGKLGQIFARNLRKVATFNLVQSITAPASSTLRGF